VQSPWVLGIAPNTRAELTTIYVKFLIAADPTSPVYAVAWLKSAKKVVIGFALPDDIVHELLENAPFGMTYKGLTKYFRLSPGIPLPRDVAEWARIAFDEVTARSNRKGPGIDCE
jgi:hypothetical protein